MEVKKGNDVTQYFLYCNTLIKVLLLHKHYENILQFLEDFCTYSEVAKQAYASLIGYYPLSVLCRLAIINTTIGCIPSSLVRTTSSLNGGIHLLDLRAWIIFIFIQGCGSVLINASHFFVSFDILSTACLICIV